MKTLFAIILTKTKLLRFLAFAIVGWLVGAGVIKAGDKPQVGEAVAVVLLGVASYFIEGKKDDDAAELQTAVGAKPDGWAGPQTAQAVAKAIEVRRAIVVQGNPAK